MSKNVYANGMEISAKKDGNKSICAMPDVCLSPPSPPAGPVPIPYPNTAKASDTSDGSKSVKIGRAEIGLKNSSNYKKSMGDEAATKSLGMGVVTHTIQDKMKFAAWSFDVKIEGKNVIRHMDITTHNHMNTQNSGSLALSQAKQKVAAGEELTCEELDLLNKDARDNDVIPSKKNKPITLTTASRTDAKGNTKFMKAIATLGKARIKNGKRDGYQSANTDDTMSCTGESAGGNQRRNHTEPKLIQPEFKAGGSIKMKIHHASWLKKNNKIVHPKKLIEDSMPCDQCKKAICAAGTCEPPFKITLCNKDNDEVEPACNSDGTPKPESDWAAKGLA